MYNILFILAFLCGFAVYRLGVRDGQRLAAGGTIDKLIKKKQKTTEEEQRINRGMENILNYANRRRGEKVE